MSLSLYESKAPCVAFETARTHESPGVNSIGFAILLVRDGNSRES